MIFNIFAAHTAGLDLAALKADSERMCKGVKASVSVNRYVLRGESVEMFEEMILIHRQQRPHSLRVVDINQLRCGKRLVDVLLDLADGFIGSHHGTLVLVSQPA